MAGYETDPRIGQAERDPRWVDRLAPAFKSIHPLSAPLPLESVLPTSFTGGFSSTCSGARSAVGAWPHAHALATFGLDPEDLTYRFKAYPEYFGIQAEPDTR